MGADYYEAESEKVGEGLPNIGIGRGCDIRNAIIDKNARIGDNVVISPEGKDREMNGEGFYIRDGIVVIPKVVSSRQGSGYSSVQEHEDKSACIAASMYAARRLLFRSSAYGRTLKDVNSWLLGVWEHKDAKGRVYRARVVPLTGDRYFVSFQSAGRKTRDKKVWEFEGWISRIAYSRFLSLKCDVSSGECSRRRVRIRQLSGDRPEYRHPSTLAARFAA